MAKRFWQTARPWWAKCSWTQRLMGRLEGGRALTAAETAMLVEAWNRHEMRGHRWECRGSSLNDMPCASYVNFAGMQFSRTGPTLDGFLHDLERRELGWVRLRPAWPRVRRDCLFRPPLIADRASVTGVWMWRAGHDDALRDWLLREKLSSEAPPDGVPYGQAGADVDLLQESRRAWRLYVGSGFAY